LVLNELDTSLHPDLLPALGRLIAAAAARSQIIVVSHAAGLIDALQSGHLWMQLTRRRDETSRSIAQSQRHRIG